MKRHVLFLPKCLLITLTTSLIAQNLTPNGIQQIQSLAEEKRSRTPEQRKLDSHLHYAAKIVRGQELAPGIVSLPSVLERVKIDAQGMVLADIKGDVNPGLLAAIATAGGKVVSAISAYREIRARVPLVKLETLAGRADVTSIRVAAEAFHNGTGFFSPRVTRTNLLPGRAARAARVREQLAKALPALALKKGLPFSRLGVGLMRPVSEGDVAHGADIARSTYFINGTGVKVCILSDGANSVATLQASGDLPANVTIVPGQEGDGDEGTAMMEIVYDLAPGAELVFATAFGGVASFASNIQTLRTTYNCDIIVDDVTYFNEGVFQDGPIAQAVNAVTDAGALYLSSAGNFGSKTDNTSGVWEGDFVDSGSSIPALGDQGKIHNFGGSNTNEITSATDYLTVKWSDQLGASRNDYDLYVMNSTLTRVTAVSNDFQDGTQDPLEMAGPGISGGRAVVVLYSGVGRALHLNTNGGRLAINTTGVTYGHNAAAAALTVAAVDFGTAGGGLFAGGAANPVETYSSDGLRRIFYSPDGAEITAGNLLFSTTGGKLLQKVDIAAADCVSGALPAFSTFCGTSAAAPHAAAIAALMKSAKPSLTAAQLKNVLKATALDIMAAGVDRDSGSGIVMADRGVKAAVAPPTADSASPNSGAGSPQTFTFAYSGPVTSADLDVVYGLFNSSLSFVNGCGIAYSRSGNLLYMFNDAGSAVLPGAQPPGTTATLSNSQCTLNIGASSTTYSGATLRLQLSLSFRDGFVGSKSVYLLATTLAGLNSGWQQKGTWTGVADQAPSLITVTPNAGTGVTQAFNFVYRDPDGYTDLSGVYALFNSSLNGAQGCYFFYNRPVNRFYLVNDAGTGLVSGSVAPGGAEALSNSQCTLNGTGSVVTGSGSNLNVTANLTFLAAFTGSKNIYGLAVDSGGLNSGWQTLGTWSRVANRAPTTVSVTPGSGTGLTQAFSLVYSDPDGYGDLSVVYALFNSSLNVSQACYFFYNRPANRLYLVNDAGTGLVSDSITPGAAGTLSNGKCTLSSGGLVTGSSTNLTVPVSLTFAAPAFSGAKSLFMLGTDTAGANSSWVAKGTWIVP